ncbi:MAG TPA: hypothetical protein VFC63_19315 [Blastocatellia bacterium]|nr:hypothetical protein [Blastocatellia bacterium]
MPETKSANDFQDMYPGAAPSHSFGTTGTNETDADSGEVNNYDTAESDSYSATPTANGGKPSYKGQ